MSAYPIPSDRTLLDSKLIGGLAPVEILHPPGTFALTPASLVGVEAIASHASLLGGVGLDWGSGSGCLSIVAARIPNVSYVTGLEITPSNVIIARENARRNAVEHKTAFYLADSYLPFSPSEADAIGSLRGRVDFILANPPSSEGDDGFGFRRIVARGAADFLRPGGVLFLNVSYQYGPVRVDGLLREAPGFSFAGVLASTSWVPFDLGRPDLLDCLRLYAACEETGGLDYVFPAPGGAEDWQNARQALENFQRTGASPSTKWQTLLFRFRVE